MKCNHDWKVVLGLILHPQKNFGHYEYQGKCKKCGEAVRLNNEMTQYIFAHGGLSESD